MALENVGTNNCFPQKTSIQNSGQSTELLPYKEGGKLYLRYVSGHDAEISGQSEFGIFANDIFEAYSRYE